MMMMMMEYVIVEKQWQFERINHLMCIVHETWNVELHENLYLKLACSIFSSSVFILSRTSDIVIQRFSFRLPQFFSTSLLHFSSFILYLLAIKKTMSFSVCNKGLRLKISDLTWIFLLSFLLKILAYACKRSCLFWYPCDLDKVV